MPDEEDIVAPGEEIMSPKEMHWLPLNTSEAAREWRPEKGRTPTWKAGAREGNELRNFRPTPESGTPGMGSIDSSDRRDVVDDLDRLFLRHPPPMGTLRRAPPLVQYRLQALQ